MKSANNHSLPQQGFTLIELLVSMLVGLIILAGVVQVFQGNFINSRYQDNMALLQENGRFTMAMLTRQFQMAGYSGCMTRNVKARNTLKTGYAATFHPDRGIEGWEYKDTYYTAPQTTSYPFSLTLTGASSGTLEDATAGNWTDADGAFVSDTGVTINAVPGSDMFRIWGGSGVGANIESVSGKGKDADTVVTVDDISGIPQDQIIVLNNCQAADIAQACNVNGTTNKITLSAGCKPGNDVSLELSVQAGGNLYVLQGDLFYVGRRGDSGANPPSLFKRALNSDTTIGAAQELVEGVENLQLMYGLDTSDDKSTDVYLTAKQLAADDWADVMSVRVSMLIGSVDDNVVSEPLPVFFNGATHTPTDRRVRQVFTKTVNLRNRSF